MDALSAPISRREHDVLELVVLGRTNPQIARELYISVETVKTHVKALLRKFEASSRLEVAVKAAEVRQLIA